MSRNTNYLPDFKFIYAPFKAHCDWINEYSVHYSSTIEPATSFPLPKPSAKRVRAFGLDWLESTIKSLSYTAPREIEPEPVELPISEGNPVYYRAYEDLPESVFNLKKFYNFINQLPIDSSLERSTIISEAYNHGICYNLTKTDLVEQMFLAAVNKSNINIQRLLELLAKKKHLLLSNSDKS